MPSCSVSENFRGKLSNYATCSVSTHFRGQSLNYATCSISATVSMVLPNCSNALAKSKDFCLPPMGVWWQYVVPLHPEQNHHSAARLIQSCMREALCYRWARQAKRCVAAKVIHRTCRQWMRQRKRRKHIESVVRLHMVKRAFDSRMRNLRGSRRNRSATTARGKPSSLRDVYSTNNKVKIPAGFCALVVSCEHLKADTRHENDLLMSVNPKKMRVLNLYDDFRVLVEDDFTLCINGVPLLPNVFEKKLSSIGVCAGEAYKVSFM